MPARIESGLPDFDPKDKPTVRLTEMGRAFASALRFSEELEETIPIFFKKKAEEEAARRGDITEDWFDAKRLLGVMDSLYESVSLCRFHLKVEAGIQKAAQRMFRWDDLGKDFSNEELARLNSFISWCLLAGITLERQRKLEWREILAKISQTAAKNSKLRKLKGD